MKAILCVLLALSALSASAQQVIAVLTLDEWKVVEKMRAEAATTPPMNKNLKTLLWGMDFRRAGMRDDNFIPERMIAAGSTPLEKFLAMSPAEQAKSMLLSESAGQSWTDPPRGSADSSSLRSDGESAQKKAIRKEQAELERMQRASDRLDELREKAKTSSVDPKEMGAALKELAEAERAYQKDPDPTPTPSPK